MTSIPQFESSWSLGEAAYQAILERLRPLDPKDLLEFGSGTSTLRLSQDFPSCRIVSLENDAQFHRETDVQLRAIQSQADVRLTPLRWHRFGPTVYLSFRPTNLPASVDAVLIDGPPIATRRGREACLYHAFPKLRVGGLVFLDDFVRSAEQRIVRNWLARYHGALELRETIDVGHTIAVLEKTRHAKLRSTPDTTLDNWYSSLRLGLSATRHWVRGGRT